MLCKLWDAAANDAVGGRPHNAMGGSSSSQKAILKQYQWAGSHPHDRKSHEAALRCTGLVAGLRLAALSRPNF
eukprot:CAMPEP_0196727766 /NCGR_PEP_ID=MMETSP1091-20130531/8669_1 /TAXON_ID=302021 /ORGANISM="Rhodomonas sp., Strain CCMP768" /LENGTH=72 /DNA_ID=CAMNT_0042070429 /DNA_START=47 /DNA_END=265 /DNA_ORIENTATION=+